MDQKSQVIPLVLGVLLLVAIFSLAYLVPKGADSSALLGAAAAARPGSIYVDNNNNGLFDVGDQDLSGNVGVAPTYAVTTDNSIVIANGVVFRGESVTLHAGQNITIKRGLVRAPGLLEILADQKLEVERGGTFYAKTLHVGGGTLIGDRANFRASEYAMVDADEGPLTLTNSSVIGSTGAEVNGFSTSPTTLDSVRIYANRGTANINMQAGPIRMTRNTVLGVNVVIQAVDEADIVNSSIRGSEAIWINVDSSTDAPSIVDLTGTRLTAPKDGKIINATVIKGMK